MATMTIPSEIAFKDQVLFTVQNSFTPKEIDFITLQKDPTTKQKEKRQWVIDLVEKEFPYLDKLHHKMTYSSQSDEIYWYLCVEIVRGLVEREREGFNLPKPLIESALWFDWVIGSTHIDDQVIHQEFLLKITL